MMQNKVGIFALGLTLTLAISALGQQVGIDISGFGNSPTRPRLTDGRYLADTDQVEANSNNVTSVSNLVTQNAMDIYNVSGRVYNAEDNMATLDTDLDGVSNKVEVLEGAALTTNDSPTMAAGTTWTFDNLAAAINITANGAIYVGTDLAHLADVDTAVGFTDDKILLTAGGLSLFSVQETAQNLVQVGDGTDVDFTVLAGSAVPSIFVEGSSHYVGIGTKVLTAPLQIGVTNAAGQSLVTAGGAIIGGQVDVTGPAGVFALTVTSSTNGIIQLDNANETMYLGANTGEAYWQTLSKPFAFCPRGVKVMTVDTGKVTMAVTIDMCSNPVTNLDDEVYSVAAWDKDLSAPTKNAVSDKIESIYNYEYLNPSDFTYIPGQGLTANSGVGATISYEMVGGTNLMYGRGLVRYAATLHDSEYNFTFHPSRSGVNTNTLYFFANSTNVLNAKFAVRLYDGIEALHASGDQRATIVDSMQTYSCIYTTTQSRVFGRLVGYSQLTNSVFFSGWEPQ